MRKLVSVWPAALLAAAACVTLFAAIQAGSGRGEAEFSSQDLLLSSGPPALTGFGFAVFGGLLGVFLRGRPGGCALAYFHWACSASLVCFAGNKLGIHWLGAGWAALFAFLPATMIHAAGQIPPGSRLGFNRTWILAVYGLAGISALAALTGALDHPPVQRWYFAAAGICGAAGLLYWLGRAAGTAWLSGSEASRDMGAWLLGGLVLGFVTPLVGVAWLRLRGISWPEASLSPMTLWFPLLVCFGLLATELRQSRWQLVQTEKMATMGNLLAGLAHEINNPLTFIYSNVDPMRESLAELRGIVDDPSRKGATIFADLNATLDTMEEGATRAKEIIENLRYFAYPGRREKSPVDLNRVLEHDIALLAPKWKGRLRIVRSLGEIPKVEGLAGDLGQAFLNILANACDATPKRGVIRVRSWREGEGEVTIAVRDSGVGIAKEVLPRIFDPFFTTKEQGEGTGLGLAIALQIVQKHRGRIDVKSEPGKGTEMRVTLPLTAAPTPRELEDGIEAGISARREV